jgi:hypothetical protein
MVHVESWQRFVVLPWRRGLSFAFFFLLALAEAAAQGPVRRRPACEPA